MTELEDYFLNLVKQAEEKDLIPKVNWEPWSFSKPKLKERGDLNSFTIIRTIQKVNKETGTNIDPQIWAEHLISISIDEGYPNTVSEIYAREGFINIRLKISDNSEEHKDKEINEETNDNFTFEPIGYIESCFGEKFGTPRQSQYSPYARGSLTLSSKINTDAYEGLEEFSHIWLIFVFHASHHNKQISKIKLPRLNGRKKGVYATRSPHRFNPIGLSAVQLLKIVDRTLYLQGLDLIDGTPILDIKPYHPADSIRNFNFPQYISAPLQLYTVEFHPYAKEQLSRIMSQYTLKFYTVDDNLEEIISNCLGQDPSTVHMKLKHSNQGLYGFSLDKLSIVYIRDSEELKILVVTVEHEEETQGPRARTELWLEETTKKLKSLNIIF